MGTLLLCPSKKGGGQNYFHNIFSKHSPPTVLFPQLTARSLLLADMSQYIGQSESGQVRPRQGTEICNPGAPSPLEALHWIYCAFSPVFMYNLVGRAP